MSLCSPDSKEHASLRVPPVRNEYAHLEALIEEGPSASVPGVAALRLPDVLLAAVHTPAPTEEGMRRIAEALKRPDVEPEGILEITRKLAEWLKPSDAAPARAALASAGLHAPMVCAARRCGHDHGGV